MAITSSWRMIVEVVPGKNDGKKDRRDKEKHDKQQNQRRRHGNRAPNLLGLSLSGGKVSIKRSGQAGLPDEEVVGAAEDDDEDDDAA